MSSSPDPSRSLRTTILQSPPVDLTIPYSPSWIQGRTILITGGASGFGSAFFTAFAQAGANVIIGDINSTAGEALVARLRTSTSNPNHHYIHCDVTSWPSQVAFFKRAIELSPTGGIDTVIANAGIVDRFPTFETPKDLDADSPPPPNFKAFDVDLIGVMYTTHLAYFYLPRNPRSSSSVSSDLPSAHRPDRHILLLGSVASLMPLPGQVLYNISKHGVLGMFRACRGTAFMSGIRINMLCPYFIDTPILPAAARALLAGGAAGKPSDVVEAAMRLCCDTRIAGRALVVGPKLKVKGEIGSGDEWELVPQADEKGKEMSVWECYADDFEECEVFVGRFLGLLNGVQRVRGWTGYGVDMLKAVVYPLGLGRWLGGS